MAAPHGPQCCRATRSGAVDTATPNSAIEHRGYGTVRTAMRGANPLGTYDLMAAPHGPQCCACFTRPSLTVHTASSGLPMDLHFAMNRPWWRNPMVRPTSGEPLSRPAGAHAAPPVVLGQRHTTRKALRGPRRTQRVRVLEGRSV